MAPKHLREMLRSLRPLGLVTALTAVAVAVATVASAAAAPAGADLVVRVFASGETVYVGQKVVYTVTVLNRGPAEASSVTVTAAIGNVAVRSATLDGGTCATTPQIACALPTLARNRTARVRITVAPSAPGEVPSSVSASSATPDDDPTSNQATATLAVRAGHAGPPRVSVKGRIRTSVERTLVTADARVGVDEPARVVFGAFDQRSGRPLVLQPGTRIGSTVLRAPRGTVRLELARDQTLRVRVVLRRLSRPPLRLALTIRAVDGDGESTQIRSPFVATAG